MKRLLPALLLVALILSGCHGSGENVFEPTDKGRKYTDHDWNLEFYDNCGLPTNRSVQWIKEDENKFIRFRLDTKHYGMCSSDRNARNKAPYWERAELKQVDSLKRGVGYKLEFHARFMEGYDGNREAFWQIHSCSSRSCCRPPIIIKFNDGVLMLSAIKPSGERSSNHISSVKITDLLGKWSDIVLKFSTNAFPKISLELNQKTIFDKIRFTIPKCGIPHFKFGIYRPGSASGTNQSIVDFDKIKLSLL